MEAIQLFPYQEEGAGWLASRKVALLADEMGLGKSAQAIRACDIINARSVLVVCPAAVRINWSREFQLFGNRNWRSEIVFSRAHRTAPPSERRVVICSYDLSGTIATIPGRYDAIILDEAHYLKSTSAVRTRNIFGKSGLVRKAERTWALTGTPMPNHPGELWVLLYSFGVTELSYDQFVDAYCKYYLFGTQKKILGPLPAAVPVLRSLVKKITLRRTKEEVMPQLPAIHFSQFVVEPGPVDLDIQFTQFVFPVDRKSVLDAQLLKERELINHVISALPQGTGHTDSHLPAIEALAKSISTLRRYTGLQKVEQLGNLIHSELTLNAYDKIVIFAVHQGVIDGLRNKLKDFNPVTLYGNTPPHKRQNNIDRFQKNPHCRVFIGNIQAAGTGITLTAAHQVVFAEHSWTPGDNAQAAMRVHRIGQTKTVFIRFCALADSFDEFVSAALRRKARNITQVIEGPDYKEPTTLRPPAAINTMPRCGNLRRRKIPPENSSP